MIFADIHPPCPLKKRELWAGASPAPTVGAIPCGCPFNSPFLRGQGGCQQ